MVNVIVLAICGFFAALGEIELSSYIGSLALSLAITLAIYAFILSCIATLMQRAHLRHT
jgi:uncharacterized membrane protein YjjB (DUF3815 family)